MLLNPFSNDGALPVVDVETDTKTLPDRAAHDGGYVDDGALGKRERDVDRLTDGQRHGRFELHAADGKIPAFGGHAVGTIVAPDSDRSFERDTRWTPRFAAELKLSFCRSPLLGSGTTPKDCDEQHTRHNSGRNKKAHHEASQTTWNGNCGGGC